MAKLERLLNLMAALLETERPLTADELKRRIEGYPEAHASFRRAFERDKDDLREMGVPISLEPLPNTDPPQDGYRIRKADYYMRDPGLAPDELAALHLAANAIRVDTIASAEAMRKLGGVSVPTATDTALASVPTDPRLATLFSAVGQRQVVRFRYKDEDRSVEPWRLDFMRGRWYLSGFDRGRQGERHYRLDRIPGDITAGPSGAFERHAPSTGVRKQPWELGDQPPRLARLLIDADHASWARHHIGQPAEEREDGSVVLEVEVTNAEAFRGFALTFLEHAEILDPPDLRQDMIDWLAALVGQGGTGARQ